MDIDIADLEFYIHIQAWIWIWIWIIHILWRALMETSAELLYLLKFADKDDIFGFKDEFENSECLQWLFFWHGSGAPYQGNLGFFRRAAEKLPCRPRSPFPADLPSII